MAIEHFFLNFGNVKLQNKISALKNQWQQPDEIKTQENFVDLDDLKYADFLAVHNSLFVQDIEHQLLLKHMMEYQF